MNIDTKKFNEKIYPTKNHHKTKTQKTQIVIANSLRLNDNHIIRLKNKDFGKSKMWPAFTINRGGDIFKHFNEAYYSDFIGNKEVDKIAITIVLENMGWLRKINNHFYNWINEICDEKTIGVKKWMGYTYWQKYTTKQMNSLNYLCHILCEKHNIIKSVIEFHHFHKDMKKYRGVVLKSNHIESSTDSNPLLDLDRMRNKLIDFDNIKISTD